MLLFIALAAAWGADTPQVVQQATAGYRQASNVQYFFRLKATPSAGDVLIAEFSFQAGNSLRVPTGWTPAWCADGRGTNGNPATAGNDTLEILWRPVQRGDSDQFQFLLTKPQPYMGGILREWRHLSTTDPIAACRLATANRPAAEFTSPKLSAGTEGDVPVAVIATAEEKNGGVAVRPPRFEMSAQPDAAGWNVRDAIGHPVDSKRERVAAEFAFRSGPIAKGAITALYFINASEAVGGGRDAGIRYTLEEGQRRAVYAGGSLNFRFNRPVNISLTGQGDWSCVEHCLSSTYRAPAHVSGGIVHNGVTIAPPDSIYAADIAKLPVNAQSTAWTQNIATIEPKFTWGFSGGGGAWGAFYLDSSAVPMHKFEFAYGGANVDYPNPRPPLHMRENGALSDGAWSYDTHEEYLDYKTQQIWETYGTGPSQTRASSGETFGVFSANPYVIKGGGAVSGLPYAPLYLTAEDVRYGLNHPLDFAFPSFVPMRGGNHLPWGDFGYAWPASSTNLGNYTPRTGYPADANGATGESSPPRASLPGLGSWARLSNGWCSANLDKYSGWVRNILYGACHHGFILSDWTTGGAFQGHTDTDIQEDPNVMKAIGQAMEVIASVWFSPDRTSNIEWIDQSPLSPCSPWWNCPAGQTKINVENSYWVPPNYAEVTLSDGEQDHSQTFRIALIPITAGTLHPNLVMVAGSPAHRLTWYVNGSTNQEVRWNKETNPYVTGTGTVTSDGMYTPAAAVSTVTYDYLVGTSVMDPHAQVHVLVRTIPKNSDGSIRIDAGSDECTFKDEGGFIWVSDVCMGVRTGIFSKNVQRDWSSSTREYHVWSTATEAGYGDGDLDYGEFVVPANSHWRVEWMSNQDRGVPFGGPQRYVHGECVYNTFDWAGPTPVGANGSIGGFVNFGLLAGPDKAWRTATPYRYTMPATVGSDGLLDVRMYSYSSSFTSGVGCHHVPNVNGVLMVPDDATKPHWAVDASEHTTLKPGESQQLYLIDWFTGEGSSVTYSGAKPPISVSSNFAGDARWSITERGCSGSKVDAQSGLYTAPPKHGDCRDVVTVSNDRYSAKAVLTIEAAEPEK